MRHKTSCNETEWDTGTGLTTHPVERPTWGPFIYYVLAHFRLYAPPFSPYQGSTDC